MILSRGALELEFFPYPRLDPRANIASCCLRVSDARALHAAFAAADLPDSCRARPRLTAPVDHPWSFREFALVDPDGNLLRCLEPLGTEATPPTRGNGKICYLEIPTIDIARSVTFYERVFGWQTRKRGDGATAFDDAVGEVSGSWVTGRPPSPTPGLLLYVMVDDVPATMDSVVEHGGRIVQQLGADAPEITARFADPDGNVLGLYQEPTQSRSS